MTLPRIAMVLGDPAGIGPEIAARLLSDPANLAKAEVLLVADRAEVAEGARIAGVTLPLVEANAPAAGRVTLRHVPGEAPFERQKATANGGRYALATLRECLDLAKSGAVDAVCFAPLNKSSLHAAGMDHNDELHWFAEVLGYNGATSEFNVCDGLWTCRVTSHIALKDVAEQITVPNILGAIRLIHAALTQAGNASPRIAVCGLNPHNGDNGAFGREEIDVIGPAVEEARRQGLPAEGPYPADTIFLRAKEVDAIVTMYHDQGQIAMKLMGFWRGITVAGGVPVPITTCAHGSGFDIQGQGVAKVGALQAAFDLACDMGTRRARG